jgi:hypothetical protein
MTNTKTFILAALTALSLGAGTAMAQDSAFFTEQARQMRTSPAFGQAVPMTAHAANTAPQYGSSDRPTYDFTLPELDGGGG